MKGLLIAAVATVTLWTAPARADEATARAKKLFERAETHFSVGEFDEARKLYAAAYKAKQLPALLFNIGQAYWQLGQCEQARFHYRQYLARAAGISAERRARIAKLIAGCKPRPQPTSQPAVSRPVAASRPTSQASSGPTRAPTKPRSRRLSRGWFWAAVGTTGALLTAGIATALVAQSKNDDYLDPSTPIERRRELRDDGRTFETLSWVAFGVAGAAAIGSVVLYLLSRPSEAPSSTTTLGAAPAPGGGLLVWGGTF